jgi:hypothetical protein
MEHHHQLSRTTHTVEMEQIEELNNGLRERDPSQAIRASLLDLQEVELTSGSDGNPGSLPADAVLVSISCDGPPEYPYLYAHFRAHPGDQDSLTVELHTDALRKLSSLLHLQHLWGSG